MIKRTFTPSILFLILLMIFSTSSYLEATVLNKGTVDLTGGFVSDNFSEFWDLTAGDLVITFTYDAYGLDDDYGWDAHAWAEFGVRAGGYGYSNFNPGGSAGGAGIWLATDYDGTANTFDYNAGQDIDDKLILQKVGGQGEGSYNLPIIPSNPGNNHNFWFDRDETSDWFKNSPLSFEGSNWNTNGLYDIEITLHATSDTEGTAYLRINWNTDDNTRLPQGWESDSNWYTMEDFPAGMTWTGDMKHMQVFFGMYGYGPTGVNHSVAFKNIVITGQEGEEYDAITLEYFNAFASGNDVMLEWITGTEIDNVGFYLVKSESYDKGYVLLNKEIIPAKGNAYSGYLYTFIDSDIRKGHVYFYWLAALDVYGEYKIYGPVKAVGYLNENL